LRVFGAPTKVCRISGVQYLCVGDGVYRYRIANFEAVMWQEWS
jgi:hypothetical protein